MRTVVTMPEWGWESRSPPIVLHTVRAVVARDEPLAIDEAIRLQLRTAPTRSTRCFELDQSKMGHHVMMSGPNGRNTVPHDLDGRADGSHHDDIRRARRGSASSSPAGEAPRSSVS